MTELTEWERPTFEALRMDAEIGSYQDEFDRDREAPPFARAPTEVTDDR
jgi:hypothetical protein